MVRTAARAVVNLSCAEQLSPGDFSRIVNAREYAWNEDVESLDGAGRTAVCALLYGGELVVDDPGVVLQRLRLKDIIVEPSSIWLLIQPADCAGPFPIALRRDTAVWVLRYLVLWASRSDNSPELWPFASVNLREVLQLGREQLMHGRSLTLADIVAANRDYLRARIYPPETVGYLAACWSELKVACLAPPTPKRAAPIRSDRFPALHGFQQRMRSMPKRGWPRRGDVRQALWTQAKRHLEQAGFVVAAGVQAFDAAVSAVGQCLVEGSEIAPDLVNELIALLMLLEMHTRNRSRRASTLATYVSALRSWLLQSDRTPFWTDDEPLAGQPKARAEVLRHAAHGTFRRYFTAWPELEPALTSESARRLKTVEYVPLSLEPVDSWLERIEQTEWSLDERRSLQWQFILARRIRADAISRVHLRDFFIKLGTDNFVDAHVELLVRHDKFGHPGGRVIEPVGGWLWPELVRWLYERGQDDGGLLLEPVRGCRYELRKRLRRLEFGAGNTIHTIRTLSASNEYLDGKPLVMIALAMSHEHPRTTLESYVASRHLRQREYALRCPVMALPRRLQAQLTGVSWRAMQADNTGLPLMNGLRELPFECFRPLSILRDF